MNKCHTCVEGATTGAPIDLFFIQKLKQFCGTNDNFSSSFSKICSAIETFDVHKSILLNDFFVSYSRLESSQTINKSKGFPCIYPEYDMYYYALPSHGPHRGQHFIWKQPRGDDTSAEQQQLVDTIRNSRGKYCNRTTKREIKHKLHRLGVVKASYFRISDKRFLWRLFYAKRYQSKGNTFTSRNLYFRWRRYCRGLKKK